MVKLDLTCDLCGSEITDQPIYEEINGEKKEFCCEGCARVYKEAAAKGILDQVIIKKNHIKKKSHH